MTASTAPTQPPDKCPACGCDKYWETSDHWREFSCGYAFKVGFRHDNCSRAFAAAVELRAELAEEKELAKKDAEKLRTFLYKMWCALRGVPEGTQREGDDLIELAASLRAERDDLQAMYQRAWTEIGELRADAARARAEKAEARLGVTYCAYCGAEFPLSDDGNPDLVSEHIRTCDKHPMRELEADNAYLTHELNKAREKAATYERDWFDAKHEFGKTVKEFQAELTAARARLAELQAVCDAAQAVADDVCSALCPSVKKTGTEWTHVEKCVNLRAALASGAESEVTK